MDWNHAPLSAACVRALSDKMYDKRRAAAVEIEKMVKEFASVHNTTQIKKLLTVLERDFALSKNPNFKKGGLIGLAAVAVALGKETGDYIEELITPILVNFNDSDLRVRYYACESLYNVIKVARSSILPHFSNVFQALSKLAADPDQSVKNASELLDRLLKDIVTENTTFDLVAFMPLLRERIYTNNQFACQFIISWIATLVDVPHIDMIQYLPEILDGLFNILAMPTTEIKKMCESVLNKFLRSIKQDPSRVSFEEMANTVTIHAQSHDNSLQYIALTWVKEFVQLAGVGMLPFTSSILLSVLPCFAFEAEHQQVIKDTARAINFSLLKLISSEEDYVPDANGDKRGSSQGRSPKLDLSSVIEILSKNLTHSSVETKVAVLRWIHELHQKLPNRMSQHIEELFPLLLRSLSDRSDKVVHCDLKVLSEIISSPNLSDSKAQVTGQTLSTSNPFFHKFIVRLLGEFRRENSLLKERGAFIIRQLCVLLNSEDVFKTLAIILLDEEDLKFASNMVEHLNTILLTSPELFTLRVKLKDLKTEESRVLFRSLYKTWSHNPVATIALCFLSQNYQHACDIIKIFSDLEITVELLVEVDKLIQLIESPIFTYLRLELLEVPHNQHLVYALYGLLMILPQSEAFNVLRHRLDCIPKLPLCSDSKNVSKNSVSKQYRPISFDELLNHLSATQERHKEYKMRRRNTVELVDKDFE
ncbi:hypothetical protein V9T40_005283 [Parthenolecanium corni]|uniref:Protein VAC14 homolog n=1 Tax=Parthenolecanium corni TaxID=536013 RepID=A0AAN9TG19_9HEMI